MADQGAPREQQSWRVPTNETDIRLDAFARRCLPHISRKEVEKAIRKKHFRINGRVAKKGQQMRAGDVLLFEGPQQWLAKQPLPDLQLDVPIVYEDSAIAVLNKAAGIATHGFSGRDEATLANFVLARWPKLADVGISRWEPGLIHRLDRETSGLVLVAKTQPAFDELRRQFRRRQIVKKYLALVWGKTATQGTIESPLVHDARDPRRMRTATDTSRPPKQKAWRAVTRFRRLSRTTNLSLLEIEMETGVTHQIRVHLASIGHPIVADALYGAESSPTLGLKRHFLHASVLEFSHPKDGRIVRVDAELPTELRAVLVRSQLTF